MSAVAAAGRGGRLRKIIAVLLPDATFGGGWIEDPAAPDGWREPSGSECMTIDWATVDNPDRWAFACGYW